MTEETQQSEASAQTESQTSTPDANKLRDNKKEKCRPMTKVVIRRLPPSMTQEQFMEQVSPLPEHDYLYFVKADTSLGQYAFSRAYINFLEQQDIFIFREKFDNYVFVDSKGAEYPAVVEFAPFQRLPKKRVGKKKDLKCGTLEADPYYISFLESLKNLESESGTGQPKTEYSYQPSDNSQKKVTTTPLLEFLKQRKQEKQRLRDEKREERRRRDIERRRAKDEPTISKVLKNPDAERETSKDNKENKDEKEKLSLKDLKNRNKRDERMREKLSRDRDSKTLAKGYRERDERNKDRDASKHQRKHEEKKPYGRKDDRENPKEDRRSEMKEDRKNEPKDDGKELRDRKAEEKRGKSYEKMRQEKKRLAEAKRQNVDTCAEATTAAGAKPRKEERESSQKKDKQVEIVVSAASRKTDKSQTSKDDTKKNTDKQKVKVDSDDSKSSEPVVKDDKLDAASLRQITEIQESVGVPLSCQNDSKESAKSRSNDHIDQETNYSADLDSRKDTGKVVKRRSSLESGGEGGAGDGGSLRRHKSLDGADQSNLKKNEAEDKEKDKKDPRLERRIRNKDRPAMEIYRPGMGKFSKQRLEREKSANDDRASLSQSPTPSSAPSSTSAISMTSKPTKSATEVRSMTFKRSASRDLP
ncbi:regulator of nonsense transcripts 3B [Cephus cinctus]|uniref:Regulator of nonsense transcripts 3B n=1 Tax=Cephus cinctus TaxID=211228 RepID=A0AAJ7BK24_CEPCN|nr:regulator of nonsense transcripts 3B [Cephus cinctus]